MSVSLKLTSSPAGVCGVPLGVTAVCQAGTSFTQPQSNFTVPPRLGSCTCSTPASVISLASSTIATTAAPVRLAMSTVSPRWSAWPWVSRIVVGSTSPASTAALGLPDRNGSISTRCSPSEISKQAWPRKRMSGIGRVPLVRGLWGGTTQIELLGERESDRDADEHAEPGLLGEQHLYRPVPLLRILFGRRLADRLGVAAAEPAP